jgi:hypothetical protein
MTTILEIKFFSQLLSAVLMPSLTFYCHSSYLIYSLLCQTNARKAAHKDECAHIDLPSLAPHGSCQMVVAAMPASAYAAKFSKSIKHIAVEALDVDHDPERGFQDALIIHLKL